MTFLNFKRNKRGNAIIDTILLIVVLIAFGITIVIMYSSFGDLKGIVLDNPDSSEESKEIVNNYYDRYPAIFTGGFVTILFFTWIAALVFSYFVDVHPVFFTVSIILLIILAWVGALLANGYDAVTGEGELLTARDNFPVIHFFLSHFVEFIIFMGATVIVAMFARVVTR